jgi:hypothetical protein
MWSIIQYQARIQETTLSCELRNQSRFDFIPPTCTASVQTTFAPRLVSHLCFMRVISKLAKRAFRKLRGSKLQQEPRSHSELPTRHHNYNAVTIRNDKVTSSANTASPFSRLPLELIPELAVYLPRYSILALALVSRGFYEICRAVLGVQPMTFTWFTMILDGKVSANSLVDSSHLSRVTTLRIDTKLETDDLTRFNGQFPALRRLEVHAHYLPWGSFLLSNAANSNRILELAIVWDPRFDSLDLGFGVSLSGRYFSTRCTHHPQLSVFSRIQHLDVTIDHGSLAKGSVPSTLHIFLPFLTSLEITYRNEVRSTTSLDNWATEFFKRSKFDHLTRFALKGGDEYLTCSLLASRRAAPWETEELHAFSSFLEVHQNTLVTLQLPHRDAGFSNAHISGESDENSQAMCAKALSASYISMVTGNRECIVEMLSPGSAMTNVSELRLDGLNAPWISILDRGRHIDGTGDVDYWPAMPNLRTLRVKLSSSDRIGGFTDLHLAYPKLHELYIDTTYLVCFFYLFLSKTS